MNEPKVEPRVYEHYKGGLYRVLFEAVQESTRRDCVVYMSMSDGKIYVRDSEEFNGSVLADNDEIVKRFEKTVLI